MPKTSEFDHRWWRTRAIASEKVGRALEYQAAERTGTDWPRPSACAASVTHENNPKSAGVVRATARSDH